MRAPVSLYIHVPFCQKKCPYCAFYIIPDKEIHKRLYLEALKREWKRWAPQLNDRKIISIYFGGGTPALLGAQAIADVLSWIIPAPSRENPLLEITLEANPENISYHLMQEFRQAGINRLSLGVQSLSDRLLQTIGREHSAAKAIEAIHLAHQAGFSNLSIDLMYDLPHQTFAHWEETLEQLYSLPITHLSLYNLTLEPHTSFFKHRSVIAPAMPTEAESLKMYQKARQQLPSIGLFHYEIASFSRSGCESLHNSGYWMGRAFIGMGPSAMSYWEGKRFRNIARLHRYAELLEVDQSPIDFEEKLEPEVARRELFLLHLRLVRGVNLSDFDSCFGQLDQKTRQQIAYLVEKGLLDQEGPRLKLSESGLLLHDAIASELI